MDISVFLVMALILASMGFFITQPLLRRNPEDVGQDYFVETPLETLLNHKNAVYAAIKETEFDYKTNKLSDEDYAEMRAKLEAEAVELLKEIEALEKGGKSKKKPTAGAEKRAQKSVRYCDKCGTVVAKADAKFCPSCGESLT